MDTQRQQIRLLPLEVQSKIKSSITITSLSDVVIELIKNSLDARARAVYVDVDYLRGGCCVEDDGNGIPAGELSEHGHFGSMYCTSKHNASTNTYGSHGRFISSLSALSLLSITSRHEAEAYECTICFHETKVIARQRTIQEHQRVLHTIHGTKVTVRDLFRSLPVRVKHRAIQYEFQENLTKEFEDLKRRTVSLLLAWSKPVKIVLSDFGKNRRSLLRLNPEPSSHGERNTEVDAKLQFRLNWICTLLAQAGYIAQPSFTSWVTASARTSTTCIRAAISLEPAPTKQIQFVSFGIRPVNSVHGSQIIFDEVNCIFAQSSFGAIEDGIDISEDEKLERQTDKRYKNSDCSTRKLRGMSKGVDRWPMFYIRIDSSSEQPVPENDQAHDTGSEAARVLHKLVELLKTLFQQFLEEHHFRPCAKRPKRKERINGQDHLAVSFPNRVTRSGLDEISLQSADTIKVVTRTAVWPSSPNLRQHVARQGFDSWSRVKSGNREGFDHILSSMPQTKGLHYDARPATTPAASTRSANSEFDTPQVPRSDERLHDSSNHDLKLLLQDLQNKDIGSDSENRAGPNNLRHSIVSESDAPTMEDEDVVRCEVVSGGEPIPWKNPMTRRVVHVNSRTGLVVPRLEEYRDDTEASKEEYSSHPLGEAVPLSKKASGGSFPPQRKSVTPDLDVVSDSWIGGLIRGSERSISRQLEAAIPSVAPEEALKNGGEIPCCSSSSDAEILKWITGPSDVTTAVTRLNKSGLDDAQVLAQVDRKFILVKIANCQTHAQTSSPNGQQPPGETVLVLIDQHAADERCQVEGLYAALGNMKIVQLLKPIYFEVSTQEVQLFNIKKDFFAGWGFSYDTQIGHACGSSRVALSRPHKQPSSSQPKDCPAILVTALPELIAERCRLEPKILIDLLRNEVWARVESKIGKSRVHFSAEHSNSMQSDSEHFNEDEDPWLTKISTCPKGLIDIINSRACRSAIMFNDVLSIEECKTLVKRLAKCNFPFQCAHGRPSMVVLGGLGMGDTGNGQCLRPEIMQEDVKSGGDFARAFDDWRASTRKAMGGDRSRIVG